MRDHAYDRIPYRAPQLEHRYGTNVRILADPLALTQLARLCAKGTYQPEINTLVAVLYRDLLRVIVNAEFTRRATATATRMIDSTPHGVFHGETIDPEVRAVTVNIARAGTLPSQITYDFLNTLLDPRVVRQDHFVMARVLDEAAHVTGAKIFGSKIGGDVDDAILLFPDPMGATGGSMCTAPGPFAGGHLRHGPGNALGPRAWPRRQAVHRPGRRRLRRNHEQRLCVTSADQPQSAGSAQRFLGLNLHDLCVLCALCG